MNMPETKINYLEDVLAKRKDAFLMMRRALQQRLESEPDLSNKLNEIITDCMSNSKMKQSSFYKVFVICEIKNLVGPIHWTETLKSVDCSIQGQDVSSGTFDVRRGSLHCI